LRKPNVVREEGISILTVLPKEFGLEKYIDFELQFDKVYLSPIKAFTQAIGWETEHVATLDFLFD